MSLKVVIASTQRGWRGGEEQARLLADGLVARGHRVHLMARRETPFALRMRGDYGHHVHCFKGRGWNPKAIVANRRFLRSFGADIIHLNDSHALNAVALAGLGVRGPRRIASRRVMFPIHNAFRYRRFCDRMICISQAVAMVARQAGLPDSHLDVVHDGVDPRRVAAGNRQRGRSGLEMAAAPMLLCVAALTNDKGHATLLEAMRQVVARRADVRLLLAGEGPCRSQLEQTISRTNLGAHVQILGQRGDVPDLIQACDLFVFPAHNEGLGSSVIDAMMAQRPVVCSSSGGTAELFQTGYPESGLIDPLGWLVPPHDSDQLARAILESLEDPAECRRRAIRAHQHASKCFSVDRMVEETVAVYRKALGLPLRRAA